MKGKVKAKTIIITVILLLAGVLGVLGVNTAKTYLGSAAGGMDPQNIRAESNEDGRGAEITWVSDKESMGVVEYGTTPASLLLRAVESQAVLSHRVALAPLKPNVSYYFRIRVGDEIYDNGGIPYSFRTEASVVASPTPPQVTIVPLMPTTVPGAVGCDGSSDYNGDGVINSLDRIDCLSGGGSVAVPTTAPDACSNVDYDQNGVINSVDRIKCLQAQ